MTTKIPILHFNDVYRVKQTSRSLGGTITADQFAAKIANIRTSWGESSRALDFLAELEGKEEEEGKKDKAQLDNEGSDKESSKKKNQDPLKGLVLFSGDAFNPSIESSVTRGEHMVDVLNACSIDCACVGNHDFDFGYPHLQSLMKRTNFPWTFTNIADVGDEEASKTDDPQKADKQVGGTLRSWVCEVEGIRIGCIGLVEKDWIATVPAFPPSFRYRSMVLTARQVSKELRDPKGEHRCDIVIAITHCRLPNDIDLANDLGATKGASSEDHGVDLVLGGHDHTYYIGNGVDEYEGEDWKTDMPGLERDEKCLLVKSGTDFHDLSEITLEISEPEEGATRRRRIVGAKVLRHSIKPSDSTLPELKKHIDQLMERVDKATGQPVAFTLTPMDCRMDQVRTRESATGDLIADILMHSYEDALREREQKGELSESRTEGRRQVDMALICGGSLRGDSVFGPGTITLRDILSIMPFEDAVVVKELKGQDIWDALENGFSAFPSQEGKFPQFSGISVTWDSRKPSGKRVVEVCLLEDVHLFHSDGSRKSETEAEAEDSIAFQRSEEGGYSIEVNRPKIRKGKKLEMDKIYVVVTREYMAESHDGYEALSRGEYLIDDESGALMSTQVRKFLLGASLIWRLKSFRENSDESGKGVVGRLDMLSNKTKRAIERANALSKGQEQKEGNDDKALQSLTPKKGKIPAALSGFDSGSRFVIDSSPGGIRDAIHVGASEHHSQYDAASKLFKDGHRRGKDDQEQHSASYDQSPIKNIRSNNRLSGPLSAPPLQQSHSNLSPLRSANSKGFENDGDLSNDSPNVSSRHLEVSPEDAKALNELGSDIAVIAPFTDGRLINLADGSR